ncbi:MAG: LysR family transcriptional regulator [Clostridia bacterium]|nr:LysR family transcriptional regulator [Clostridia bacterium]
MNINYDYYKIFYYVAKYRSFTKAADAMYACQPNLTRAVKRLEAELGCKLFYRSSQGITLTREGEKLYEHVSAAVEHICAAEREITLEQTMQRGNVAIGATENALHAVLLPVLRTYRGLYPQININVTNYSTKQAIDDLNRGMVDLAVVTSPVTILKSCKKTTIKQFREVAVCGTQYSHLCGRTLSIKEICDYPVISLSADTITYKFYSQFFLQNGAELSPCIGVATTDQIISMAENNLGIGFVPEFIYDEADHTKIFKLQVAPQVPAREICLLEKNDHPLHKAAEILKEMIENFSDR